MVRDSAVMTESFDQPFPNSQPSDHACSHRADKTVLVLGGGAPTSALMAGALCALHDRRVTFDVVYTSGAGAFMGLMYIAPSGISPSQALRDIPKLTGVADAIYRFFPVGYKTFHKPGPLTRPLHHWGRLFKMGQFPRRMMTGYHGRREDTFTRFYNAYNDFWLRNRGHAFERLYNDWIDFWLSAVNPSDLNPFSKGMYSSFPFLEEMVDFSKLDLFTGQFYMNAYNITDQNMEIFTKKQIAENPEIFRAALAMPFIYPPVEVDGKLFIEGADYDPISFGNLTTRLDKHAIKTIVVVDVLSCLEDYLVREPRNLWDAYQISIMAPIVSLAKKNMESFGTWIQQENQTRDDPDSKMSAYVLNFKIPKEQQDYLLDWSYSNLSNSWRMGYHTGEEFVESLADVLHYRPVTLEPLLSEEKEPVWQRLS